MTVIVVVHLVDGGMHEFYGEHYLAKYKSLVGDGYTGKRLIEELLATDDWAAPPFYVTIMDGDDTVATIPYT
jgi:hypothetical protein